MLSLFCSGNVMDYEDLILIADLLALANEYDLQRLKEICETFIQAALPRMAPETLMECYFYAQLHLSGTFSGHFFAVNNF